MKVLVILLIFFTGVANAADVTLIWDPNPEPTCPGTGVCLDGYRVHWGHHSKNYAHSQDAGNVTQHTIQDLEAGTVYYFAVTAYGKNNGEYIESDFSDEVTNSGVRPDLLVDFRKKSINPPVIFIHSAPIAMWNQHNDITTVIKGTFNLYGSGATPLPGNTGISLSKNASFASESQFLNLNAFTIFITVRPANSIQGGPARILTYSKNQSSRNFTIGQEGSRYVLRVRRTADTPNGIPQLFTPEQTVEPGVITHIAALYGNNRMQLWINGQLSAEMSAPGSLVDWWDPSMQIGIGNEISQSDGTDRHWAGDIFYPIEIYNRAFTPVEIQSYYQ